MYCPFCSAQDTKVIDSRLVADGGQVRRRRECPLSRSRATRESESSRRPARAMSGFLGVPDVGGPGLGMRFEDPMRREPYRSHGRVETSHSPTE